MNQKKLDIVGKFFKAEKAEHNLESDNDALE